MSGLDWTFISAIIATVLTTGTIIIILVYTAFKKDKETFTTVATNDKDVISISHDVEISGNLLEFNDPLGLSKTSLFYSADIEERTFEDGWSGYNIKLKNRYGTEVEHEMISFTQRIKLFKSNSEAFVVREIFSYKLPKKINSSFLIAPLVIGDLDLIYGATLLEEIKTDNVAFNDKCTVAIVDPDKNAANSDDEDVFYILTPQLIERISELYDIFKYRIHILFKGDRVYFMFRNGSPISYKRIDNPEALQIIKIVAGLLDLQHPINEEDKETILAFNKKYKKCWTKGYMFC